MTTTSRQAESSANAMLGALLQGMVRCATVRYENTQVVEVQAEVCRQFCNALHRLAISNLTAKPQEKIFGRQRLPVG